MKILKAMLGVDEEYNKEQPILGLSKQQPSLFDVQIKLKR